MTTGFSQGNYKGYRSLSEARMEWDQALANGTWGPPNQQPRPPCSPICEPVTLDSVSKAKPCTLSLLHAFALINL